MTGLEEYEYRDYECPGCGRMLKRHSHRPFWYEALARTESRSGRPEKWLKDGCCRICGANVSESPEDDSGDRPRRRSEVPDDAPRDRAEEREPISSGPSPQGLTAFHWTLSGVGLGVLVLVGVVLLALSHSRPGAGVALASPNQPPPATQFPGLLAYWSFDEGTGTRAADASGNDLHATLVGAGWTDGIRGKALSLRGPGSYLDYGSSPRLSFHAQAPFTFAFWTKTARAQGTLLSQRRRSDGSAVLDVLLQGGRVQAQFRPDGNEFAIPVTVGGGAVNDRAWHHLALTRTGDRIELFLDGVAQEQRRNDLVRGAITTDLHALGSERYWISRHPAGNPHFEGAMDEFCIFARALEPQVITALAGR
jgi:hypothetical protein